MRIRSEHDGSVSGTVTSESVACGIDTSGLAHIMNVLSGLYVDAPAAVLREYCTNALDSHRQAGNPDPIRVTLPSPLNPLLTIHDSGVGLSEDDILAVYATYGASSKRHSDDQVGAFGLGAKSAFTLGQQFTVTGVKDGQRTLALFALNGEGIPTVSIQWRENTDQPDGVVVQIAVTDVDSVRAAAPPLFSTWSPGTVLVDGEQPHSVYDNGTDMGNGIVVADPIEEDTTEQRRLTIVMGSIGYPVTSDIARTLYYSLPEHLHSTLSLAARTRGGIYATVDIGDVDIAPSREGMKTTDRTMRRLRRVIEDIHHGVWQTLRDRVNAAPSMAAAAFAFGHFQRQIPVQDNYTVQWRGHPLDRSVDLPYVSSRYAPDRACFEHQRSSSRLWLRDDLRSVLVVTNVPDGKAETAIRHAKAFHTAADQPDHLLLIFSQAAQGTHEWFEFGTAEGFRTIHYDEYMSSGKEAPSGYRKPRGELHYQVLTAHGGHDQHCTADQIAARGRPVVTVDGHDKLTGSLALAAFREHVLSGTTPVLLTHGRTSSALARRLGSSIEVRHIGEETKRVAAQLLSSVTDDDRDCYRAEFHVNADRRNVGQDSAALSILTNSEDRITNPRARAILDAVKRGRELTATEKHRQTILRAAARAAPEHAQKVLPALSTVTREFPLLWGCREEDAEHVIAYINALT